MRDTITRVAVALGKVRPMHASVSNAPFVLHSIKTRHKSSYLGLFGISLSSSA